ncbi:response regulator [Flavobacterium sp.]|uniref:LytR/AlgR family response regulator transcription factor n=1 Tax=Flavobacterium sp. TaxID=239 RepID=UPI001209278A|nr:response regulator [Flavobacterium sp.]RZJ69378.1 MAG: response regulator transcription factor [Flavobacterium sp.]
MDSKLKCILLDDELPGLAYLKMLCGQLSEIEVVKAYNDPEKFLSDKDALDFDLCITDIEMPGISGLELASALKDKLVIFTTAYKNYASDAFDLEAVDYIVKPVKMERLEKAIHKAIQQFSARIEKPNFFQPITDKGRSIVYFHRISMISTAENDSRDKTILLDDGTKILLKNIKFTRLLEQLPEAEFCRVNKQEIVSIRAVRAFSNNSIEVDLVDENGKNRVVSLSETYKADFYSKAGKV